MNKKIQTQKKKKKKKKKKKSKSIREKGGIPLDKAKGEWELDHSVVKYFQYLTRTTTPSPHEEEEYREYLFSKGFVQDSFGNFYQNIGESKCMFTAHLDTADRGEKKPLNRVVLRDKQSQLWMMLDDIPTSAKDDYQPTTIEDILYPPIKPSPPVLGADDKTGVALILHMIDQGVPGFYYLFLAEEIGRQGSRKVANDVDDQDWPMYIPKSIEVCLSFDRSGYTSVITEQMCEECCSSEFGQWLADSLNTYNPNYLDYKKDPTGSYTDSYSFVDQIPECSNISVGYFNAHTSDEKQNLTFLCVLADALCEVDWESAIVKRDPHAIPNPWGRDWGYQQSYDDLDALDAFGDLAIIGINEANLYLTEEDPYSLEVSSSLHREVEEWIYDNPSLAAYLISSIMITHPSAVEATIDVETTYKKDKK